MSNYRIWIDNEAYSRVFKDEVSAAHIIFVFSLLRAIEQRKQQLVTKSKTEGSLTQQELREMELHRAPGSQFFLISIIAAHLENVLDQPIPNRFRLRWTNADLQTGVARWMPVLEIVLAFGQTLADSLKDGLKSLEKVRSAEAQTRQVLASIRQFHAETYKLFSKHVVIL